MLMQKRLIILFYSFLLLFHGFVAAQEKDANTAPRPIGIEDAIAWKSIRTTILSNDGNWFAYQLSPNKGDSEIIIRNTKSEKEFAFPIGEAPRRGSEEAIAFSEDSKWLAFTIYPAEKQAKKLKKQKKKLYNKGGLLELATGEKLEFDKVKAFAFSGENPAWFALHKYPGEKQKEGQDEWTGADLILRELAAKSTLNIGNVSEFAFNKSGTLLAWLIDARDKSGNGIQIRDMHKSIVMSLDSDTAAYKSLNWTEEGDAFAVLKGLENDDYEDKLYSLLGFSSFSARKPQKVIYEPDSDENFPEDMTISPNHEPLWTEDLTGILFGINETKKKENEEGDEKGEDKKNEDNEKDKIKTSEKKKGKKGSEDDPAELVLWHWKDKRLQSRQQVQEKRDKNFSYLSIYRVKEKKFIRLADDELRQVEPTPRQRWAIGFDNRNYELQGSLEGRRYRDIYVVDLKTGARKLAVEKNRWYYGPSPEDSHFYYYNDGHFYTYELATTKIYNITENVPTSFIDEEDDHNVIKPPIRPLGWTKSDRSVLLYDNWDVWNVPVQGGKGTNLTVIGKKDGIRYQRRFQLDPDEKGIDLSGSVYFTAYGEWTKKGGIARVDKGKPGTKMLLWDDAIFSDLLKAKDKDVLLYTKQTHNEYPDYYSANKALTNGQKITDVGDQQNDYLWSAGSRLIDYQSDKGKKLQAALFLPANYEEGKSYPTVVYIYENLSQWRNRFFTPQVGRFNKSLYTSQGYAVLMPDIVYEVNDPGMSAVWCVLPAVKAAIKTGIVDAQNVAIHGHSWGGYQTSFLITQTEIFKAAVAGAPLTNMISMFSSIYWNSGRTNQSIFESSQGRFTGGYWDNIEAYTRNSPVYYATNVKTPLLLLHNDKDGAVDWNQGIEYYNTLRRLKKPVVMLQYKGENHGLRKPENMRDYSYRMLEFFDHYLKGKPAPKWLEQGIPHLKLKDHLKERARKKETQKKPKEKHTD